MRVADLLRAMVDMVDSAEQQNSGGSAQPAPTVVVVNNTPANNAPQPQQIPQPAPQPAGTLNPVQVPNTDDSEKTTMVPPLQQKIELLKKSVGVDNEFSQGFDQVDQEHDAEQQDQQQDQPDELERVKKMAGIPQAIQHELAKDEPLDF